MKKIGIAVLIVVIAAGAFAGAAAAQSSVQAQTGQTGLLHEYMEEALAAKLNLPLGTIESEFDAGKTLYQIALDHGITQANLQVFVLEVRTQAIQEAVADGVITQTQADRMLQQGGHGMGHGMTLAPGASAGVNGGSGSCDGTGVRAGSGMMGRGGHFQQANP
jgi:hypothetical protein